MNWVPFDIAGWPEVAACLPLPWPAPAACFDLRWHTAQGRKLPGRGRLARRWGWTGWAVRQLLDDIDRWSDPGFRQPAARTPPGSRQVAARSETDEPKQSGDSRQVAARSPPERRQRTASHTRALLDKDRDINIYPSPQPPPPPGAGERSRAWVESRALRELADRRDAGGAVDELLVAYECGERWLVDSWMKHAKGTGRNGHRVPGWPDAPDDLDRRVIRAGLVAAARRWREESTFT